MSITARLDATSAAVLGLAATAWLALVGIGASPWAGSFSHGALEGIGGHPWALASLSAGWVLMVAAMMLPTTLPLVALFARVTEQREDRRRLRAILLGTYVVVWVVAGVAMHAGDFGLHQLVHHWPWLRAHAWTIGAATLAIAGAYQLTAVKARCLRRCRAPQSFIRGHWRGGSPTGQALRIGLDHGAYCVGCCWSLMLVMFSVGVADVAWMLALTAVMLIEKTARIGRRITAPVGVWLLAGALLGVVIR